MGVASYGNIASFHLRSSLMIGNCLNNADGDHKKVKHKTHKLLGFVAVCCSGEIFMCFI